MKIVAVIGCGKFVGAREGWAIGHAHAEGWLHCGQPVRLLGVDISPDNLAAFGAKFGLPPGQLFASTADLYAAVVPDAVSICTWPRLHHPLAVEALERGVKGLAVEKPFTLDVAELRDLERRVREAGAHLVIAHQRRRDPGFRLLKEIARSGRLGDALHVRSAVGDDWDVLSWTSHWFDMANFVFDGPPEWVLAGMAIGDKRCYQHAVEDASVVYAHYGENRQATFLTGPGHGAGFEVHGPRGLVRMGNGCVESLTPEGFEQTPFTSEAAWFAPMLRELAAALDGGPEPLCSIRHCAVATEMAYAAHESARTARRVRLPLDVHFAPLEVAQRPIRSALEGSRVVIHADDHYGSGCREGLAEAVAALTGKAPAIIDAATRGIGAADLESADIVLISHTQAEADVATREALGGWVRAGKPLLVVHGGLGAWPEWEEFGRWCGKVWEWGVSVHPHEAATLRPAAGDPLRFGWSEAWLPKDEVYVRLKDTAPCVLGLTAHISDGVYPVAWRNAAQPNVGAWMPGHRRDSWRVPAMRAGLERLLLSLSG